MTTTNNLLSNKWLSPGTFGVIILCFLLPFCNIKCGGMKVASVQGIDMIIGGQPELSGALGSLSDKTESTLKSPGNKTDTNIWVIVALAAAVCGAALHFIAFAQKPKLLLGIAALGLLALIIFAVTKNSFFDLDKMGKAESGGRMEMNRGLSIGLGIGYWLACAGFAFLGWLHWQSMRPQAADKLSPLPDAGQPQEPLN